MGSDIIQFLKAKAYRKIRDLGHGATGQTVLLHDDSIDEDFVCKNMFHIMIIIKRNVTNGLWMKSKYCIR